MGQHRLSAPRLCGQHAAYILRRMNEMVGLDSRRGDATMNAVAAALTSIDRRAVSDHLARMRCEG